MVPAVESAAAAEDVPPFIEQLAQGKNESIDFEVPLSEKPPWLDEARFKRGQKFATEHLFGVVYCQMLSLFMLFAMRPILRALMFTGRSSTPQAAFKRYFGTAQKVISWYEEDLWCNTTARNNIAVVRGLHRSVFNSLHETDIHGEEPAGPGCSSFPAESLLQDFREACGSAAGYGYLSRTPGTVWLSQLDMALTQFGFVGLLVMYPQQFGIHNIRNEELEDFVYMWRVLGYLLGIKDRYNFCRGDLATVRERSRYTIERIVKPALREIDSEWEHMARCLVGGIGLYTSRQSFDSCILFLCHVLEIRTPRFRKWVSYKTCVSFYCRRLLFFLAKIPFVSNFLNDGFKNEMRNIVVPPVTPT